VLGQERGAFGGATVDLPSSTCCSGHHPGKQEAGVLVLTRKRNQSIMIGDEIEISVLAIMGEKVRIGISAPREVPVHRREVYDVIQIEQGAEAETVASVEATTG